MNEEDESEEQDLEVFQKGGTSGSPASSCRVAWLRAGRCHREEMPVNIAKSLSTTRPRKPGAWSPNICPKTKNASKHCQGAEDCETGEAWCLVLFLDLLRWHSMEKILQMCPEAAGLYSLICRHSHSLSLCFHDLQRASTNCSGVPYCI